MMGRCLAGSRGMRRGQVPTSARHPAAGWQPQRRQAHSTPERADISCHATTLQTWRLKTYKGDGSHVRQGPCQLIELEADGSDTWRLDAVADLLRDGAIGIVPTDSFPALVCDCENADAVEMLAAVKEVSPKKPMSILVRGFQDVDKYTMGWPAAQSPGQPDCFSLVRRLLPGPYTFILAASKSLPKVKIGGKKMKKKQRHTVGVRMPDNVICSALLSLLERPLLCTSVHASDENGTSPPLAGVALMEVYPDIDFVVDSGHLEAAPSTIIDMTGAEPEVLRVGKGDPSPFE